MFDENITKSLLNCYNELQILYARIIMFCNWIMITKN